MLQDREVTIRQIVEDTSVLGHVLHNLIIAKLNIFNKFDILKVNLYTPWTTMLPCTNLKAVTMI